MDRKVYLDDFHEDILNEIGSITSGRANTSLSKLVHKGIKLTKPTVNIISANKLIARYAAQDIKVTASYIEITEGIKGHALFLLPTSRALTLIKLAFEGFDIYSSSNITESFTEQAVLEISNIFTKSYMDALSDLLKIRMGTSLPIVATEKVAEIIRYITELSLDPRTEMNKEILVYFETKIEIQDIGLIGVFIYVIPYESLDFMLKRVDMIYKKVISKKEEKTKVIKKSKILLKNK